MRRKLAASVAGKADTTTDGFLVQQASLSSSKKKGRGERKGKGHNKATCYTWRKCPDGENEKRDEKENEEDKREDKSEPAKGMRKRVAQKHHQGRSTQQCSTTHWSALKDHEHILHQLWSIGPPIPTRGDLHAYKKSAQPIETVELWFWDW